MITRFPASTPLLALVPFALPCQAAVLSILPDLNNVAISQVVYTDGTGDIVQNASAPTNVNNGVQNASDTPLSVKSIQINDGGVLNLEFVNVEGATVHNVNSEFATISGSPGIGVFNNGVTTPSLNNLSAFSDAVAATTTDSDLRNFVFYDYLNSSPTSGTPDYDILYNRAMNLDDYVVVSERNGNTYFEVTPLKADGTPYANANVLRFGGNGGASYDVYDWNSGYAASGNQPTQAQAFSVASVSKFFDGTTETPGPVFGFRIDNDGEADVKVLIMGSTPFSDNPKLVPEPSTLLTGLTAGLLLVARRKRRPAR